MLVRFSTLLSVKRADECTPQKVGLKNTLKSANVLFDVWYTISRAPRFYVNICGWINFYSLNVDSPLQTKIKAKKKTPRYSR